MKKRLCSVNTCAELAVGGLKITLTDNILFDKVFCQQHTDELRIKGYKVEKIE